VPISCCPAPKEPFAGADLAAVHVAIPPFACAVLRSTLLRVLVFATRLCTVLVFSPPPPPPSVWAVCCLPACRAVFQRARSCPPAIVFLDEVDAMVGKRGIGAGSGAGEGVSTSVLATLLNEMDGVGGSEGVLVVAATNRLDMLDPALLR
jgi:hypothetical protein